jgi:3',5'-cyclic-AMP phosphodiesterase
VVVFQHHYPFQVWEDFAGPGIEEWRNIVQTRPIVALFAGHTHYGQLANDGRKVYVATRSIGDPEGGPAGYAIVHLDDEDFALTYRSVEDSGPIVLITHPRRLIFATTPRHIVTGPDECRVRAWSKAAITSAKARIDNGDWVDMESTAEQGWSIAIAGDKLSKGEHTLEVRLTDSDKKEGSDKIVFGCDLSGRYNAFPMVEPTVKETKFC